jgi:hypothetical protein
MFGSASSVQNFDILANTVKSLALTKCSIPSRFVHRQLDGVPIVAPDNNNWCSEFYNTYKEICGSINLELAKRMPRIRQSFWLFKDRKSLGNCLQHSRLNLVPPGGQKEENNYGNHQHSSESTRLTVADTVTNGKNQLHFVNVPISQHLQVQP